MIIVAFVCFWPLALLLTIQRVRFNKSIAVIASGVGLRIFGIFLAVFGVIGILGCLMDPEAIGGAVVAAFFLVGGVFLIIKARQLRKEAELAKQYFTIIVDGNVRKLDHIAATMGKSYDVVKAEVQKMIQRGYLRNAYINESTREVVLPVGPSAESAQPQARIVTCPFCGANNTIHGVTGECEYCDSPIKCPNQSTLWVQKAQNKTQKSTRLNWFRGFLIHCDKLLFAGMARNKYVTNAGGR